MIYIDRLRHLKALYCALFIEGVDLKGYSVLTVIIECYNDDNVVVIIVLAKTLLV